MAAASRDSHDLTPIGVYPSINGTIRFFEDSKGTAQAKIPEGKTVQVKFPDSQGSLSTAEKIECLLQNFHLIPTYDGKKVSFKPIPPENKTWEQHGSHWSVPDTNCEIRACKSGAIKVLFGFTKTYLTWNWKHNHHYYCYTDPKNGDESFSTMKKNTDIRRHNFFTTLFRKYISENEIDDFKYHDIKELYCLIDQSIIVIPLHLCGYIFMFHKKGAGLEGRHFRITSFTNREEVVRSCIDLADGSVAVMTTSSSVLILQPKPIDEGAPSLDSNPYSLKLYHEMLKNKNEVSQYNILLAGMVAALKSDKLYEARRFYEKAKKIKSIEACSIFLFYLKSSLYSTEKRRILLEWKQLNKKPPSNKELEEAPISSEWINSELEKLKNRKCRKRLFVGECDFFYTAAVIEKHAETHLQLAKAITATELNYPGLEEDVLDRLFGATIIDGIDATKLHNEIRFRGKRFKRIHWNGPYGERDHNHRNEKEEEFQGAVVDFFKSASHLQLAGDRIHISLKKNELAKKQATDHQIVSGSFGAGYRLIRKRNFDTGRYKSYRMKRTDGKSCVETGFFRELVFEKVLPEQIPNEGTDIEKAYGLRDTTQKDYKIKTLTAAIEASSSTNQGNTSSETDLQNCYFDCSTDEDSSDYWDSSSDSDF